MKCIVLQGRGWPEGGRQHTHQHFLLKWGHFLKDDFNWSLNANENMQLLDVVMKWSHIHSYHAGMHWTLLTSAGHEKHTHSLLWLKKWDWSTFQGQIFQLQQSISRLFHDQTAVCDVRGKNCLTACPYRWMVGLYLCAAGCSVSHMRFIYPPFSFLWMLQCRAACWLIKATLGMFSAKVSLINCFGLLIGGLVFLRQKVFMHFSQTFLWCLLSLCPNEEGH